MLLKVDGGKEGPSTNCSRLLYMTCHLRRVDSARHAGP